MSFITVIKKIGEKVISVVEWPFKHSAMLGEFVSTVSSKPRVAKCCAT